MPDTILQNRHPC